MSTALVKRKSVLDMNVEEWERLNDGCAALAQGGPTFLPKGYTSVAQVKACAIIAIAFGYDPFAAIQWMWPVEGKVSFHYKWKLKMAIERVPTLRYIVDEHTVKLIRGTFQRSPEHPVHRIEYTIELAQLAKKVKDKSAWETYPMEMLMSKWVDRGLSLACPDVILGPPSADEVQETEEDPDSGSGAVVIEDVPAVVAAKALGVNVGGEVDNAGNSAGGPVGVAAPPAQPPAEPTLAQLVDAFKTTAKSLGFNVRSGERMRDLVVELLREPGQPKREIASTKDITRADWIRVREELVKKYPHGVTGAVAAGIEPTSSADGPARTAAQPAAEAPPDSVDQEAPLSDEEIRRAQLSDPGYLESLGIALEKAWKEPSTVIKEYKGHNWFVNNAILLACGFKLPGTENSSKSMCLGKPEQYSDRWLTPEQVHMLSLATLAEIDKANNRGRPVVPQTVAAR